MKIIRIAIMVAVACLLAGGAFALILLPRKQAEIRSLRAQLVAQQSAIESLHAQLGSRFANQPNLRSPTLEVVPPAMDPNAFAKVAESAIPGRYKWTQAGQEKGILNLYPDHTFENHK